MRPSVLVAAAALGFSAHSADASQPISQSMAECAGLVLAMSGFMDAGDPRADQMLRLAGVWTEAAIAQAEAEGHRDAVPRIAAFKKAKYDEWTDRGPMSVFSSDFKDWAGYCRALGKSRGLDIDLS